MAKQKNRELYICKECLKADGIEYLTKDKVYYLEDNKYDKIPTYEVYDENGNKHFVINKSLLSKYFITMAEHRDEQINSILE